MSRALRSPQARSRRAASPAYRRLNRNVDHTARNKRRVAALVATLAVAAAIASVVLALAPVFST